MHVRFLSNFIITVIQTVMDEQGKLVATPKNFHVRHGDTYSIESYEKLPDNKVTLHFSDTSPLAGVAHVVELDNCEIRDGKARKPKTSTSGGGCSGCGHK